MDEEAIAKQKAVEKLPVDELRVYPLSVLQVGAVSGSEG